MAKIKINKLPKGFKLEGGKIVEDQLMRDGGDVLTTGDQADYGLVTTPQEYFGGTTFNNSDDESVRYSLSGVPKENANIEAEGGETVLTDLNDDGTFGLYNIKGPRHGQGGVPMFLPEQSFIFSDTSKMKFGKEEMAEFGLGGTKKTPANISKRFKLNDYYGELDSQYSDDISARSAELMLKKNMEDLSKLSFMQEAKKGFDTGVPLAAHPFLMMQGIDPIEFTAKVEKISEEKAKQDMIDQLSPEDQQQLMMMEQMMAQQAQQQPQQPQQEEMGMAQYGTELSDFIQRAEDGTEVPKGKKLGDGYKNPYKPGSPAFIKFMDLKKKGYKFVKTKEGKLKYYKEATSDYSNRKNNTERETIDIVGTGEGNSIYSDNLTETGDVINDSNIGYYDYGKYSGGNLPDIQSAQGDSWYGSSKFASEEAEADWMKRNGKIAAKIEDFDYNKGRNDPQWGKFQKLYEEERKIFAEKLGIKHVPYFGDGTAGAGFDSKAGAKVYNAPGFDIDYQKGEEGLMDLPPDEIETGKPIEEFKEKPLEYWKQDLANLQAMGAIDDDLLLPFSQELERSNVDYVLGDNTARINAILGSQNTQDQALGAYGVQAIANKRNTTLREFAQSDAQNQAFNVGTLNTAASMNAQMNAQQNLQQAKLDTDFYDNTQVALQNEQNFDNWKIGKNTELFNAAVTNRANTGNMNSLYDYFDIDPRSGGVVGYNDQGKELYKDSSQNADQAFSTQLSKYEKTSGKEASKEMREWMWKQTHGSQEPNATTKGQQQAQSMGIEGYSANNVVQSKNGSEMKKWAGKPFFYSGKMGI